MARIRLKLPLYSSNMDFNGSFGKVLPTLTYSGIRSDSKEGRSYISDQLDVAYRNVCKPCYHVRDTGAVCAFTQRYVKYEDDEPKFTDVRIFHGGRIKDIPVVSLPTIEWNTLMDELGAKVAGRLQTKSLLAVSLVELSKTVGMIRNPYSLLHPTRRSQAALHPLQSLTKVARFWLETRYGWQQLYNDLKSSVSAVNTVIQQYEKDRETEGSDDSLLTTRLSKGVTSTLAVPAPTMSDSSWNGYLATGSYKYGYCRLKYGAPVYRGNIFGNTERMASGVHSSVTSLCQVFGLTYRDLFTVLWELVPYSFVVDWFINVGDMALALSNNPKFLREVLSRYGYSTLLTIPYTMEQHLSQWPSIPGEAVWDGSRPYGFLTVAKGLGSYRLFNRYNTLPVSSSYLGNGLSQLQLLDGASLLLSKMFR